MKKNTSFWIITIVTVSCFLMGVVDTIIKPEYFMKSSIKVILFALIPFIFYSFNKEINLKNIFVIRGKGIKESVILGIIIYIIILFGYFGFRNIFDFGNITSSLGGSLGVKLENFIFVSLYITLINSFLEEFFFRGFSFLILKKYISKKSSYIFSSLAFALYHVTMMVGWFSIYLLLLIIAGLFIGGLIFDYFNDKYENIYSSWIIHLFANLAINTVGFILFLS